MRPLALALLGALTLGQEPEPPLSASMSVRELLARADGCDEEAVDAAMEEDDARSALVTLIRDCRQPEGEAAEREPGRARGGKRRGRGRTSKRKKGRAGQAFKLEVPRVTAEQLAAAPDLLSGTRPYILTGEASRWPALERWSTLEHLAQAIPQENVDYYSTSYDDTMDKVNRSYVPFDQATRAFLTGPRVDGSPKYLQIRLTTGGWETLKEDLLPLPPAFWTESQWIEKCMSHENGTADQAAIDNWNIVNQWSAFPTPLPVSRKSLAQLMPAASLLSLKCICAGTSC